jgi:hypothetical protein
VVSLYLLLNPACCLLDRSELARISDEEKICASALIQLVTGSGFDSLKGFTDLRNIFTNTSRTAQKRIQLSIEWVLAVVSASVAQEDE